ncbi:MAG TPA: hypothetical protein GX396_10680 [Tissierellia bacterium]|nr:hypothetical protein [Tissierellia bacterium]
MKLVSFNTLKTLDFPEIYYIKPEHFFKERDKIKEADWILYPEYWQVNSLVYGLKKRIFPNISTYHLGHNKVEMTRAFMTVCPQNIPYTEILSNTPVNQEYILDMFPFPFVAKEIKSSMGYGVHLIEDRKQFRSYCDANEILYIQEKLPIDRDMRIIYLGDEVIASYWRIGGNSFKNNVAQGGTISYDNIPQKAIALVDKVAKELEINHAGFDVAEVDGHYYFFEFNVSFGTRGLLNQSTVLPEKILRYLQKQTPSLPTDPYTPFPKVS